MESSKKSVDSSLQTKSMEQALVEVSDDEQDEALLKLNEDSFDGCRRWIPFRSLRVCGFLLRMPQDLSFHCVECCTCH